MNKSGPTHRERKIAAIHDAAEALFMECGFERASMDRISELSGLTKQTVYRYFASKEALFLAVIERMTGGAGDKIERTVPTAWPEIPPEQFLFRFAVEQLQIVVTPRLMKLRRLVIGEMTRFPELGALLHRRGPARSIGRLAEDLAEYASAGTLVLDDPHKAAAFFNWLVMGEPVNDAMLLGDNAIPDNVEKEAHARECVRIFMAAFQRAKSARISRPA